MKTSLRILYLFAGTERESDYHTAVRQILQRLVFQETEAIDVVIATVDILRGSEAGHLLPQDRRQDILLSIAIGEWDIVVAEPPCNTFSRSLFSGIPGPLTLT